MLNRRLLKNPYKLIITLETGHTHHQQIHKDKKEVKSKLAI